MCRTNSWWAGKLLTVLSCQRSSVNVPSELVPANHLCTRSFCNRVQALQLPLLQSHSRAAFTMVTARSCCKVLALAFLAFLTALLCFSGPLLRPHTLTNSLPEPLEQFVYQLKRGGFLRSSSIHSVLDLTHQHLRSHHVLSKYVFKDGNVWNPKVIYLTEDPNVIGAHLVVTHFQPTTALAEHLLPAFRMYDWQQRQGLLAMQLKAHSEPEYIGIIWLKDVQTLERLKTTRRQVSLNQLEEHIPDLQDIQRIVHHRPLSIK